ncbi:AAEL004750-PA [Aedes aegypti]|uniref:AAEL004750-PA n=1 Tax=Aedes aegypti TaxID=7159 RepID=Q17C21_AEDAE|nr:AAEL004750-PA [Aedes aegypti]
MERYEEDIYRLNLRIKELISRNDLLESQNEQLAIENQALLVENVHLKAETSSLSQSNVQYKMQLEKEIAQREQLYEANQRHKTRYRALLDRFTEQSEKVKMLEHSLRSAASTKRINHVPVEIIGTISDIGKKKEYEKRCQELQSRCDELRKDLTGAYAIIDDLEFELESIDYLEDENDRLQQEVKSLRSKLQDQSPLALAGAASTESKSTPSEIEQSDADSSVTIKFNSEVDSTDNGENSRKSRRDGLNRKLYTLHEKQFGHSSRT